MRRNNLFVPVLCVAVSFCVFGCGKSERREVTDLNPEITSTDPVETFVRGMDAYNGQDLAAVMTMFSKDVDWNNVTSMKTALKGRTALARQLMSERNIFPDSHIQFRRIFATGDRIVAQGFFQATHQGPVHGLVPTGKKVMYDLLYVITTKDGLITRNSVFFNPAIALRQIGAIDSSVNPIDVKTPETPEITRGEPNADNENTVKAFLAAVEGKQFESLGDVLADDCIISDMALYKRAEGKDNVVQFLREHAASLGELKIAVSQAVSVNDFVAVGLSENGTFELKNAQGELEGKKEVSLSRAYLFELRDQKIKKVEFYYDELDVFQAFDMVPQDAFVRLSDKWKTSAGEANKEDSSKTTQPVDKTAATTAVDTSI